MAPRRPSMTPDVIAKRSERQNRITFDAARAQFGLAPKKSYRSYINDPVLLLAEATAGGWSLQNPQPDTRAKKANNGKVRKSGKGGKVGKNRKAGAKAGGRKRKRASDSDDESEKYNSDGDKETDVEDENGDGDGSEHRNSVEEEEEEDEDQPEAATRAEQNKGDVGSEMDIHEQNAITTDLSSGVILNGVGSSASHSHAAGMDIDEDGGAYALPSAPANKPPAKQHSQPRRPTRSAARPAVIEVDEHQPEDEEENSGEEDAAPVNSFPPHALSRSGMMMLLGAARRKFVNRPQELADAEKGIKSEMRLRGLLGQDEDC